MHLQSQMISKIFSSHFLTLRYFPCAYPNNIMQHLIPTLLYNTSFQQYYATPHSNTTTYVCNTSSQHYYLCMQHLIPTLLRMYATPHPNHITQCLIPIMQHLILIMQHLIPKIALKKVVPSAKREGFVTVPDTTWSDIGALDHIREELKMAILVSYADQLSKVLVPPVSPSHQSAPPTSQPLPPVSPSHQSAPCHFNRQL